MNDNALIKLVIAQLNTGLAAYGIVTISTENGLNIATESGDFITTESSPIITKQSYQPTRQGANTAPTCYLNKVSDQRIGSAHWNDTWQSGDLATENDLFITTESGETIGIDGNVGTVGSMIHTETQQYLTTFQLSSLAAQDPENVDSLTASDILNYASAVLQSMNFIAYMQTQGVGIIKVKDIRNPYFIDDRNRFEANPSFDFVLSHKQVIITTTPIISSEEFQILRV